MGAWGVGPFENDDAGDWVWQLEEAEDLALVQGALEAAAHADGSLESPTSSEALAAAEVVAALAGHPAPDLPDEVQSWVSAHPDPVSPDLRALALAAVARVASDSELQELWAESEEGGEWSKRVEELRGRLGSRD
ncbi:MAG TPA: DUF4259 domain-containing protein [Gemmatimonadales bacterium]|nr:DUF4259 domain-containing protein [Gemmatimonadales bacterium]